MNRCGGSSVGRAGGPHCASDDRRVGGSIPSPRANSHVMKFTSKDEYLRWRSEWKANYKTLTQQIRDVKFARWFEDSRRGGVKMNAAQTQRYEAIAKAHKTQW